MRATTSYTCYILAPLIVQSLPITDYTVEHCDGFTPLPDIMIPVEIDEIDYIIGAIGDSPQHVHDCWDVLYSAAASADVQPGNPSFVARCQFCTNHSYLCSQSQIALWRIYARTKSAAQILGSMEQNATKHLHVSGR